MHLEHHISELLKRHNCVIVPGFGGFIANYESAWINYSRSVVFPPFKQVLFNSNLQQNDGLLAHEVVVRESATYADALQKIEQTVQAWKIKLAEGGRVDIEEIGFIFKQQDKLIFEQNREVNLLLQAYGLKQVSFVTFEQVEESVIPSKKLETVKILEKDTTAIQTSEKHETPVISLNQTEPILAEKIVNESEVIPLNPTVKKRSNWKYAAAAAVVCPLLFYSYWIPMKTDFLATGKIQVSDFNPFANQAQQLYELRDGSRIYTELQQPQSWEQLVAELPDNVSVYNFELDEETYIPVKIERSSDPVSAVQEDHSSASFGNYHAIAGCFSVESNANNLVVSLNENGFQAKIIDQSNGLYRVSAGSASSESEAESIVDKLEGIGQSGWVLRK